MKKQLKRKMGRRMLVVGCGSIGKRHIRNFKELGVQDIIAVDPREDRRKEVESLGVIWTYSNIIDAINIEKKFDAAIVCSPTSMHIEHSIVCAENEMHLMIEKPLCNNLRDINDLKERIEENNLTTFLAYPFRFDQTTLEFKRMLDSGITGKPLFVRAEYCGYLPSWHPYERYQDFYMAKKSLGGGSLLDQSHIIDLIHWIFGDVESVFAINAKFSNLEIEADDMAQMIFKMKSGIVADVHTDIFGRLSKKVIEVKGEIGDLFWDGNAHIIKHFNPEGEVWKEYPFTYDANQMYLNEAKHFLDCLDGKATPAVTIEDGIKTMKIIEAARKSSKSRKEMGI